MSANNVSYAYPVLGNGSDIEGNFSVETILRQDRENISLDVSFKLNNEYILGLIRQGKAKFVIEASSRGVFFSKSFESHAIEKTITIPTTSVRSRLSLFFYIIATCDINDYAPNNLGVIYRNLDTHFNVGMGDIIAVGGAINIPIDYKFDPLSSKISSLIRIRYTTDKLDHIDANFDGDAIEIMIPENIAHYYRSMNADYEETIHAVFVLPVLIQAIHKIMEDDEQGGMWKDKIRMMCDARGINFEKGEELKISQELLGYPILRGVRELADVDEMGVNHE